MTKPPPLDPGPERTAGSGRRISPAGLAWLAVPVSAVGVVVLASVPTNAVYNPPFLFAALNIVFLTVILLLVSYLAARSFFSERSLSILLLGCGALALGFGGALAGLPLGTSASNWKVTVYGTSACLAAVFHLLSAAGGFGAGAGRARTGRPLLAAAYLFVIIAVFAIGWADRRGILPVFFVEGTGTTVYEKVTLWAAAGSFLLCSLLLNVLPGGRGAAFRRWYAVGLGLIAVGLVGVSLETRIGSPLHWTGSASQYLGCVSILAAMITTARTDGRWGIPLERALLESELRYQSLVEMSPDAILVHSEGRYVFANPAAARLFGARSPEEVIGRDVMELIVPEYRNFARDRVRQAYAGEMAPLRETKFLRFDGQAVDVETSGVRVDFGGRPAIQVMARDISARKRAEAALRESEKREMARSEELAKVLDSVPAAVWIAQDPEARKITGNRLSDEWLHVSAGTNVSKSAPEGERPETFRVLKDGIELSPGDMPVQRSAAGEEVRDFEFTISYPDGTARNVVGNATPLRDERGNPRGSVSAFIDITGRKTVEEALRRSEESVRRFIETIPVGVIRWSLDGSVLDANDRFLEMTGYDREDIRAGRVRWIEPAPSELGERDREALAELKATKRHFPYEKTYIRKDGSRLPVLISSVLTDEARGEGIGFVLDLTEQKAMNERLRRQAEMLEHAPVLVRNLDDEIILWNSGMEKLYGYTRKEALGKVVHDLLTTRHPIPLSEIFSILRREGRWEGELRHIRRDGTSVVVTSLQVLHVDAQGTPTAIIEINSDITKRKDFEDALQKARSDLEDRVAERTAELSRTVDALRRQADLLDLAEDPIIVRDENEKIVFWNQGAWKTYGWSREEALGRTASELLRVSSPVPLAHVRRQALENGYWEGELGHMRRDGRMLVVASRWAVRRLPDGTVETLEINRDVTERTRAEEAARAAGLYARGLLEASLDPLVTISREGKITDVNMATEEATGITRDRLVGTDFSDYFTEPDNAARGYRKVLSEGSVRDYPLTIRHVSGKTMDVLYTATVYRDESGGVL